MVDLVEFKRLQGARKNEGAKWSHASRIIGFDGDPLGARTVWVLCDGVPVCVALDKIRPCTPEKALAYLYLNRCDTSHLKPSYDEGDRYVVEREDRPAKKARQEVPRTSRSDQEDAVLAPATHPLSYRKEDPVVSVEPGALE